MINAETKIFLTRFKIERMVSKSMTEKSNNLRNYNWKDRIPTYIAYKTY
jgi:hypothetical protein